MQDTMSYDIKFVGGVGEARARLLAREIGVQTVGDLLYRFPMRYIDRRRIYSLSEIDESLDSTLIQLRGRITGISYSGTGRKQRLTASVGDATGTTELLWFHGIKWIEKRIEVGREYMIFGRPSFYRGTFSFVHPEIEPIEQALSRKSESGYQGIYPSTEKLSQGIGAKAMSTIIANAWQLAKDSVREMLPHEMLLRHGLMPLREALYNIHFPQSPEKLRQAQYRLKFDELLGVQLTIQSRRTARLSRGEGFMMPRVGEAFNTFYRDKLPFPLTSAQQRVIKEIRGDMISGRQMNRLLQGDVGSGKTMVALMSMLLAVDNGYQAAIMAPTEILARQHYASMSRMTEGMNLRIAILTGSSKTKERREALERTAAGEVDILVGTHALIEDKVAFRQLGYVVIDE